MTNDDRAERARLAFEASRYDANDPITNLYDLICDLLHLADRIELDPEDWEPPVLGTETNGEFVARMSLWHYREEVKEEEEDRAASQA